MKKETVLALFTLLLAGTLSAAETQFTRSVNAAAPAAQAQDQSFVVKRPGEITFTSGIVIEGRVEKPQVMLVFTKEKIKLEPVVFRQSPLSQITAPLRMTPLATESK